MKILKSILLSISVCISFPVFAQIETRFGNEQTDTTALTKLLDEAATMRFPNPEARVSFFARHFIDTPYAAHTLEGEPETLTVRIDSLDCTTFVETAMALALTAGENRTSWRDFIYNLRRIRYRGGEINGYPSRLHYICDWVVDNHYRGNFNDVTNTFPRFNYMVKSIDFMTSHRNLYPALADQSNFERVKSTESGYRNHRFPYIKTSDISIKAVKSEFHDGDVVALVSNLKDLDVTHMGIIAMIDGEPYLLHASSSNNKVEISQRPLAEFMKKNRQWIGLRVIRLQE